MDIFFYGLQNTPNETFKVNQSMSEPTANANPTKRSKRDTWQARKGAQMRRRIIKATIKCIVEFGYEKTTVARVAEVAGSSQGAMQYHFASKLDLMKAAISHLQEERMAERERDLAGATHRYECTGIRHRGLLATRQSPILCRLSRTGTRSSHKLRSGCGNCKPAYRKFIDQYRDASVAQVPEWNNNRQDFERVADLLQHLLEGLAYGRINEQLNEAQTRAVIDLANEMIADWAAQRFAQQ